MGEFCCIGDMSVDGDADDVVTARICSGWFTVQSLATGLFPHCQICFLVVSRKSLLQVYGVMCYMEVRCGHSLSPF